MIVHNRLEMSWCCVTQGTVQLRNALSVDGLSGGGPRCDQKAEASGESPSGISRTPVTPGLWPTPKNSSKPITRRCGFNMTWRCMENLMRAPDSVDWIRPRRHLSVPALPEVVTYCPKPGQERDNFGFWCNLTSQCTITPRVGLWRETYRRDVASLWSSRL